MSGGACRLYSITLHPLKSTRKHGITDHPQQREARNDIPPTGEKYCSPFVTILEPLRVKTRRVGCNVCHMEATTTAPLGTVIDGCMFTVPEALGDKIIHPFSDFLLYDIGTGDGIVQVGPQDTGNKLRTAPLWGLRTKARFMHDLGSLSLYNAIERHEGEARDAARGFRDLSGGAGVGGPNRCSRGRCSQWPPSWL